VFGVGPSTGTAHSNSGASRAGVLPLHSSSVSEADTSPASPALGLAGDGRVGGVHELFMGRAANGAS